MTITFNGASNPEAVNYVLNGTTYGIDKVQFTRNGVTTVVWEGFPGTVSEISLTLSGSATCVMKNCRFQRSTSYVIDGKTRLAGVYTCSLSASFPTTVLQSLGSPSDVAPNMQLDVSGVNGVPSGYSFYSMASAEAPKMLFVDDIGAAVFDPSKLKREQRNCMLHSGGGSVQMFITAKTNDKAYYATGSPLNFSGQTTLYLLKN